MADEYKSLTHSAQSIDNTITGLGTHVADTTIHVTAQNKTDWDNKQPALTTEQLSAVNSGITAEKLTADEDALADVIDRGAKNFAQTESGSATQYVQIKCSVPAGTYKVYLASLTSTDTDATNCQIYFLDENRQSIVSSRGLINRGNGVVSNNITVNSDAGWVWIYASDSLAHSSGDTISFSGAMCCTKAAWDVSHQFEPYALSNPVLTPAVIKAVDEGAKNLLKIEAIGADSTTYGTTVTKNGVEYALQADGSIVINRVSSNANSSYIFFRKKDGSTAYITDYMDNEHYLSGITGGSVGTYALFISNYNSQGTSRYVGDPALLTSSSIAPNACGISIASGYSPVNLVFKPMICTAADWAVSQKFMPYRPSWQELTAKEQANENNILSAYGGMVGKNVAKENDFTATLNKTVYCNLITGRIHISAANVSSTDTDSTICRILLYYTDGTVSSNNLSLSRGSNISLDVNIGAKIIERIVIYSSDNYNNSIGDTVTVSDLMICTQADYAADPTYQPYAMSNVGLTVENASQQSEIDYAVNTGVKNLIKLNPNTYTSGNVVVKLNDDGTVSVSLSSGSTANTTFSRAIKTITDLRDMDLILNGCPSGGNYSSGYALYISDDGTTKEKDEGNGVLVPKSTTVTTSYLALIVRSGTAINGTLTFKPMIRPAYITDSTFQPYALPNSILTPALIEQVNGGAKNIANWRADTSTISDVTFTINDDKTISTSGTATARSQKWLEFKVPSTLKAGRYVLSGCPTGGEPSGMTLYCLYVWDKTASVRVSLNDTGGGIEFDWVPDVSHTYSITVDVRSGSDATGLIFKPMICTKAEWDVSHQFEPYALSNPVLTPAVIKAVDEGAKNVAQTNDITQTGNGFFNIDPISGDLLVSAATVSTTASSSTFAIVFYYTDGTISPTQQLPITNSLVYEFNTGEKVVKRVRIFAGNTTEASSGKTITLTNFMICTAADWAVSQKFVPYALPNPTLTPAVIKAVDEGAKNLSSVSSGMISNTGGGFPIPSTPITVPIGTYIVSFKFSGNSTRGSVQFRSGSTTIDSLAFNMAPLMFVQIEITSDTIDNFNLYSNGTATISDFMICTLADWAVSQKFVPYALTNPELTAKLMTDEADITSLKHMVDPRSQSSVSGGNLDNVTVSEIRVYIAPSGLPTGVSASSVCIVETLVVDSNSAYQVITLLSNQGTAQNRSYPTYKRVKVGGVWYDWKLIVS